MGSRSSRGCPPRRVSRILPGGAGVRRCNPMKIIPKLTAALVAGTCVILGVNGGLRVRRERRFFEADRIRDHEMLGRSLEAAAAAVWKSDGEDAAIQAIDAVSRHFEDRAHPLDPRPTGREDRHRRGPGGPSGPTRGGTRDGREPPVG